MRGIGGNLNYLPGSQRDFLTAKGRLDFAFKHGKRLFRFVPVRKVGHHRAARTYR